MDTNDYNTLINIIRQIANSECRKLMKEANLSSNYFATVDSVNEDGTCNIILAGGETLFSNLLNKTGETLVAGDAVLVEALGGNLGNGYIKIKQGI